MNGKKFGELYREGCIAFNWQTILELYKPQCNFRSADSLASLSNFSFNLVYKRRAHHVISHLSLFFFATSTSGRFLKLKSNTIISKYASVPNLMKQLFHSRLLDMTLAIANSAQRVSLAIYHLISNARSWNNC